MNARHNKRRSAALLALALLSASPAFAASAAPLAAPMAAAGYDWTLLVVLAFGITGLVWIRRHITRL